MSSEFKIAETDQFRRIICQKRFSRLYKKIRNFIYPQLRQNPFFGPNIKKLKGEFQDFYRYRLGRYRVFYKVDKEKIIIFILTLKARKDAY